MKHKMILSVATLLFCMSMAFAQTEKAVTPVALTEACSKCKPVEQEKTDCKLCTGCKDCNATCDKEGGCTKKDHSKCDAKTKKKGKNKTKK